MNRKMLEVLMSWEQTLRDQIVDLQRDQAYSADDKVGPAREYALRQCAEVELARVRTAIDTYWEAHGEG